MVDVSFVPYFGPILAYLLVAMVIGAVLWQTKLLGGGKGLAVFVALVVATIFIAAGGVVDFVLIATPWIAALIISLFFLLLLFGFAGIKKDAGFGKGIGIAVVIIAVLIFLISAFVVYSSVLTQYIPGTNAYVGNEASELFFSPRIIGAVLLLIVAGLASWIVLKS